MTPARLIDIGINLAHDSFDHDRAQVIERARVAGVERLIITGSTEASSRKALELARERPEDLHATAGVHPHHAVEFTQDTIPVLTELARANAQYVAPVSVLEVPAVTAADGITIDGEATEAFYTDWQTTKIGKRAGAGVPYEDGDLVDFNVKFKVAWDASYLYAVVSIIDDVEDDYVIGKSESWTWDNVEVFIDLDTNSTTNTYSTTSTTQMRFCRGLLSAAGDDSLVESNGQDATAVKNYKFSVNNSGDIDANPGWSFEVAIPWAAATDSATYDILPKSVAQGGTVVGFDLGAADSDGDGSGASGSRNVEGGAQAFWDLDEPDGTGNEDNAYQNRRTFGWIKLMGEPYIKPTGIINPSAVSINAYPNPTTGILNIDVEGAVEIMNLAGQVVLSTDVANGQIDITKLSTGVYILKAGKDAVRIIKQ